MSTKQKADQIRRAWQLAAAHRHEWATAVSEAVDAGASWPETWEEAERLHRLWLALHPGYGGPVGLPPPTRDAIGAVSHRTTSGRLHWCVFADGSVDCHICRPGWALCRRCSQEDHLVPGCDHDGLIEAVVLYGTVTPGGVVKIEEWGPALERHWEALVWALVEIAPFDSIAAASPIVAQRWPSMLEAGE